MAGRAARVWHSPFTTHPARTVVWAFALVIAAGTGLLMLPVSSQDGSTTDFVTALFTSTSAVCVTGLVVVDTATHWSGFGEGVILALIQVGGFGIMALASLLALLVSGKLRLRMQLTAAAETKSLGIGDVRRVLLGVAGCTLIVELAVGAFLALRLRFGYGRSVAEAAYSGFFHAVSAFNNAGFGLHADSLTPYAQDPWITLPIAVAVILGGLGFPVLLELLRHRTRRRTTGRRNWSLHTRLTLVTSAALLFIGTVLTCLLEWTNPGTLAPFGWDEKILNGFFYSAMSRTAGFNAIDMGALNATTLLFTCTLMFIGGGSAGTAGGIKVTTFAVLAAAMLAEVRGEPNSTVMGRRLAPHVLRQALTVALLAVGLVIAATLALLTVTKAPFEAVLFEAVSAFATVGLSTGITASIPDSGQLILILLMFVGRLGPITLVSSLALRERTRRYQLPEERPVIG
ncbi:TrkH family potassium uptake protein [Streptomyces antarcticus]|uniref:TrkH family potassium uptake protein n=1 Tax=Streptomyces antarcticus TaxID=2996458 RepID=UPI00226F3744|nr:MULTISPECIES: potassium transporter TrkG [unclassified Streptomyces]MCY0946691.1 TrkH family potassium uptake protein [Streptomyces sp. H34-AA3]MCZ4081323.1 TrkH family potassium uptake protein [Streptomyces sp. H34-S5]